MNLNQSGRVYQFNFANELIQRITDKNLYLFDELTNRSSFSDFNKLSDVINR